MAFPPEASADLPSTARSLRRSMQIAYRAEPRLLVVSFLLIASSWVPEALGALWLKLLAATRHCTTILISHRFSTVRHADRICVLEHGRVTELGTHDELMAQGGRYRTMFDLQAQRFGSAGEEEGTTYDVLS